MPDDPDRTRLEAALAVHRPADAAEADSLARIRAFVAQAAAPFDRHALPGHLTGSAFVVDPAGRLLLHHHRRLGRWLQFGGHAEGEGDAAAVAAREAREESGLDDLTFHPATLDSQGRPRPLDVDVHAIPAAGAMPAHLHFDLRYLMVTALPATARLAAAESHALAWLSLAEARARGDDGIVRAIGKIERLVAAERAAPGRAGGDRTADGDAP